MKKIRYAIQKVQKSSFNEPYFSSFKNHYYYFFNTPGSKDPRSGRSTGRVSLLLSLFKANQHKSAGRKTTLDIQNYGCNGNLLCDHGVVERNRISFLESHGKAMEKECCLSGV